MRPRMRHEQFSAIFGKRNAPRIGRPRIRIIQQNAGGDIQRLLADVCGYASGAEGCY